MSNSTKKWYVLYTKLGCEKKVANTLTRKNIENYCPFNQHTEAKKRTALEPLFVSYVFVNIDETQSVLVRSLDHVVNFIYWLGKPAIIDNEEIELVKRFMLEYSNVKTEKLAFENYNIDKSADREVIHSQKAFIKNSTVKILLPSIGFVLMAEIDQLNVETIPSKVESFSLFPKFQYSNQHLFYKF